MEFEEKDFDEIDLSSLGDMMIEFESSQEKEEETPENLEEEENIDNSENEEEIEENIEKEPEVPSSQNTKDSPLTPYAKMLVEEGLLPNIDLENFDGSVDSLLEAQRQYDLERFESFKESALDPRVKWLQDNLEQGVPLLKLLEIEEKKFSINDINEDSLSSDENLQKTVLRNYYRETTNFNDTKIDQLIERLETLGELEAESVSSLGELKSVLQQKEQYEKEQARQQQEYYKQQQQKAFEEFESTLQKTNEIIPGVKVSDLLKDRIKQTLTTPVAVDKTNGTPINKIAKARMENPLDFEIKLAYLFELTKGFTDWTSLGSAGKRKAIDEFERSIQKIDYNKGGYKSPDLSKRSRSYLDEMEKISKQF